MFAKETPELVRQIQEDLQAQIALLKPLETEHISCNYDLAMTMVDGKVVNTLTETKSSQVCSMCGASPAIMNNLEAVRRRPVNNLEYGISSLHCWIRIFELVLHISYRLTFKQWQIRTESHRQAKEEAKKTVQQNMKSQMGLIVDTPRAGGSGNTNDGNTARKAFKNAGKFAEITGVEVELIRRLHIILQAVTCCLPLSGEALGSFCSETASLYVEHYSWYPMPATLHRLLLHSAAVVQHCLLPIGAMSEEAAETRHKDVRLYRLHRARRDTQLHTMADVFGRLLLSSDPIVSSLGAASRRRQRASSRQPLLAETRALLAAPEVHMLPLEEGSNTSSDSE